MPSWGVARVCKRAVMPAWASRIASTIAALTEGLAAPKLARLPALSVSMTRPSTRSTDAMLRHGKHARCKPVLQGYRSVGNGDLGPEANSEGLSAHCDISTRLELTILIRDVLPSANRSAVAQTPR